jgi:hypothetical protein
MRWRRVRSSGAMEEGEERRRGIARRKRSGDAVEEARSDGAVQDGEDA